MFAIGPRRDSQPTTIPASEHGTYYFGRVTETKTGRLSKTEGCTSFSTYSVNNKKRRYTYELLALFTASTMMARAASRMALPGSGQRSTRAAYVRRCLIASGTLGGEHWIGEIACIVFLPHRLGTSCNQQKKKWCLLLLEVGFLNISGCLLKFRRPGVIWAQSDHPRAVLSP